MSGWIIALIVGGIVFVVVVLGMLGGGMMMGPGWVGPWGGMMGWYGPGFALWGGVLMALFWALVICGIALLVVWLVRRARLEGPERGPGRAGALDILRER